MESELAITGYASPAKTIGYLAGAGGIDSESPLDTLIEASPSIVEPPFSPAESASIASLDDPADPDYVPTPSGSFHRHGGRYFEYRSYIIRVLCSGQRRLCCLPSIIA